jgi:hypothetical protein
MVIGRVTHRTQENGPTGHASLSSLGRVALPNLGDGDSSKKTGLHLEAMTESAGCLLENFDRFGCHFGSNTISRKNRDFEFHLSSPAGKTPQSRSFEKGLHKKIRGAEAPLRA